MKKTIYQEIILKNIGAKFFSSYGDKGYCVTFVYSNKGNFVIKGFMGETEIMLKTMIEQGFRFYYRYNFFYKGKVRHSCNKFWHERVWIMEPEQRSKYCKARNKFEFRKNSQTVLSLKRLPNRWIPEFENL